MLIRDDDGYMKQSLHFPSPPPTNSKQSNLIHGLPTLIRVAKAEQEHRHGNGAFSSPECYNVVA